MALLPSQIGSREKKAFRIACRPKPNGNTPAEPAQRRPFNSAIRATAPTPMSLANSRMERQRKGSSCKEPPPWDVTSRTPGACLTCMENVWEWCQDWHKGLYYQSSPLEDPQGPDDGNNRVHRGGAWNCGAGTARSGSRSGMPPDTRGLNIGFRVARTISSELIPVGKQQPSNSAQSVKKDDKATSPGKKKPAGEPLLKDILTVDARKSWADTGLDVEQGDVLAIEQKSGGWAVSMGLAAVDGNGHANEAKIHLTNFDHLKFTRAAFFGCLIASFGDQSMALPVGVNREFTVPASGRLWLRINDKDEGAR